MYYHPVCKDIQAGLSRATLTPLGRTHMRTLLTRTQELVVDKYEENGQPKSRHRFLVFDMIVCRNEVSKFIFETQQS